MITFKLTDHAILAGVQTIEVYRDGSLVASIYPNQNQGLHITSKHFPADPEDRVEMFRSASHSEIKNILVNLR